MLTRGPLPNSVYWRRRLVVLSIAVVLVVVFAKLLSHGSGGSAAVQVAETSPASTAPTASTRTTPAAPASASYSTATQPSQPAPTLMAPIAPTTGAVPVLPGGRCQPADVVVTPSVTGAAVGEPVTIDLAVGTRTEAACTWQVSPMSLQVKVTSQNSQVWSTVDCHQAVHDQQLTVSSARPTQTSLVWGGHSSDTTCSSHSPWAGEGTYTVTAAALGGQPTSATFTLGAPTVIVTVTPTPSTAGPSSSATPPSSATSPSGKTSPSAQTSPSAKTSPSGKKRLPLPPG